MRANLRARRREAGSLKMIDTFSASSKQEDILGALAYHVVSEEHPAKEERRTRAERIEAVRQAALRDAIAGATGLIEDAVPALATIEGHN